MNTPLAVVSPLANETAFLAKQMTEVSLSGPWKRGTWRGLEIALAHCGVGPRWAAEFFEREEIPAERLLVVGCAGALTEEMKRGDLVWVRPRYCRRGNKIYDRSPEYTRWTPGDLAGLEIPTIDGISLSEIATTRDEKTNLAIITAAEVVDMENHGVATIFENSEIPVAFLRVILDESHQFLPSFGPPSATGPGPLQITGAFFRHPLRMIQLGMEFGRAAKSLEEGLARLVEGLGP